MRAYDAPTVIPITDAEAEATDKAVEALEADQRNAVRAAYPDTSSVAERARRLGISLATLYARVDTAHHCLARRALMPRWLPTPSAKRVEQLQRWASPGSNGQRHGPNLRMGLAEWLAKRRAGVP
jgi:hypothetical protein